MQLGLYSRLRLNKSMMTNRRRPPAPISKLRSGRVIHAPSLFPAAVAYFRRWAMRDASK